MVQFQILREIEAHLSFRDYIGVRTQIKESQSEKQTERDMETAMKAAF